MLSKTLSVAMFILIAWLSIDHAKVKGMNIKANNQLAVMQQQVNMLQKTILDNKALLEEQASQQQVLATLFADSNSSSNTNNKSPEVQKKKVVPKPKKVSDILKDLNTRLEKITKHQTKKELAPASKLIAELKTEVWKIRKHKEIKKDVALSIVSLIDIALKKWKAKDVSYTTEKISLKIKRLSIHSKPPTTKKATKENTKPTSSQKKSETSKKVGEKKNIEQKNDFNIIKKLNAHLTKINEQQAKKDLKTASSLLKEFKGMVWKIRNDKGVKKDVALSMMSPIDITMQKWEAKETTYTTKNIAEKMKRLSLKKEASK